MKTSKALTIAREYMTPCGPHDYTCNAAREAHAHKRISDNDRNLLLTAIHRKMDRDFPNYYWTTLIGRIRSHTHIEYVSTSDSWFEVRDAWLDELHAELVAKGD